MEAESDTILDICLHALKDLSCNLDGANDGTQTWCEEDNIGSGLRIVMLERSRFGPVNAYLCGFRSSLDSDTTVRLLQRRGIVDTITYSNVSMYLQTSLRRAYQSWQSNVRAVVTSPRLGIYVPGKLQRSHRHVLLDHVGLCH